jgi:Family of unknown function (DUF6399)
LNPVEQNRLKAEAAKLAEVFQRSSSNVEGRNGYLSLRNHQLRGLDHPRKRECLTAMHNFFLTRADGTTTAERFFGQKPRSLFAAILGAVEISPHRSVLRDEHWDRLKGCRVADAVIKAQLAILCKEVSAFKASPTLVAIIIAMLRCLDYRCHSYLPTEASTM